MVSNLRQSPLREDALWWDHSDDWSWVARIQADFLERYIQWHQCCYLVKCEIHLTLETNWKMFHKILCTQAPVWCRPWGTPKLQQHKNKNTDLYGHMSFFLVMLCTQFLHKASHKKFAVFLQLTKSWFLCMQVWGFFTAWSPSSGDNRCDNYEKR